MYNGQWYCGHIDRPIFERCVELGREGISLWDYLGDEYDAEAYSYKYQALSLSAGHNVQRILDKGELEEEQVEEIRDFSVSKMLKYFEKPLDQLLIGHFFLPYQYLR